MSDTRFERVTMDTPKKAATCNSRKNNLKKCRCCNNSISENNHPVYLFGSKSKREGILDGLKSLCDHSEEIQEDDGLPQFICKPCVAKIGNYKKLRCVARATETANRAEFKCERFKRGGKPEESPQQKSEACLTPRQAKKKTKCNTCGVQVPFSPRVNLAPTFSPVKENN